MNALVIYDSKFGNTETIANAIATSLGARSLNIADATPAHVSGIDLLIVGSPTQGGRPTPAVHAYLRELPAGALATIDVAAFDTRIDSGRHGPFLRVLTSVIGFAAGKIGADLKARGGKLVAPPEGFIVDDTEGPLRAGEEQRAGAWAATLRSATRVKAA
ncbi:MAG: flavodoxin family protein [Dehalococcoidia bacterium]